MGYLWGSDLTKNSFNIRILSTNAALFHEIFKIVRPARALISPYLLCISGKLDACLQDSGAIWCLA